MEIIPSVVIPWARRFWALSLLIFSLTVTAHAETIYDVQYTTSPGDGTWPSPLVGEQVTIEGVVTATNYFSSGYFLEDPEGGLWSGILIWDTAYSMPSVGDRLQVSGEVYEYSGQTEINYVTHRVLLESGVQLPPATPVSSADVNQEAGESVLLQLSQVTNLSEPDGYGEWTVSDGSGGASVGSLLHDVNLEGPEIVQGDIFAQLLGIVVWRYGQFLLNPRSGSDFRTGVDQISITVADTEIPIGETMPVEIRTSWLSTDWNLEEFQFTLSYDAAVAAAVDLELSGTLMEGGSGSITELSTGEILVDCAAPDILNGSGVLCSVRFQGLQNGESVLDLSGFNFAGVDVDEQNDGQLSVLAAQWPRGDEVTLIQRPLLNIPSILTSTDTLQIYADAGDTATGWQSELFYKGLSWPLTLLTSSYHPDLGWWVLDYQLPAVLPEMSADLVLQVDGLVADTSQNAVRIVNEYPEAFYFAHVTDPHLPTHMFYTEPGSESDSSSMDDLREVFHDLDIIHPEFILLTGDLVNEGELEDFLFRRYYSRSQRLLAESMVPVCLTAGNHDLGGWVDTPPSAGTARRDWWRFFGWPILDDPPAGYERYTQDYSFEYGPLHVTMLEAYDNYDSWRYDIYGDASFIDQQLSWLQQDLAEATAPLKVLGYHYDFHNQLNINTLGVDLALWGHIHSDSGSLNGPPWSLSTDQVTDGSRAFRLVRVDGESMQPLATLHAGSSGQNLEVEWLNPNDGSSPEVDAVISNNYDVDFPEARLEFRLPVGSGMVNVTGGELVQLLDLPAYMECQVRLNVPAQSSVTVEVSAQAGGVEHLVIIRDFDHVQLTWDPYPGAVSYCIYSGTTPYGDFVDVTDHGDLIGTSWSGTVQSGEEFYRVTAVLSGRD